MLDIPLLEPSLRATHDALVSVPNPHYVQDIDIERVLNHVLFSKKQEIFFRVGYDKSDKSGYFY